MNLNWNLDSIYPRQDDLMLWDLDWNRLQAQEDSRLDAKLFNYAYAQFQFASRRQNWKPRLEKLTGQPWPLDPPKSYFQLSTSLSRSHRILALTAEFEDSVPIQETHFAQMKTRFLTELSEDGADCIYVDRSVSDLHRTLRPEVRDWIDFGFPLGREEMVYPKTEDYFQLARDFFYQENPKWGQEVDLLCAEGCIEISTHSDKLPGAFTLPMPYGIRPLVYVREVASFESMMGLIHELAHGIDFSERRHKPDGFEIPESPLIEAFAQNAELKFCKKFDPSGALYQARLELICAKQIFWYILKKRWLINFPKNLQSAKDQWRAYLVEVFGTKLNWRPELELIWLTHRGMNQSLQETQSYLMSQSFDGT